MRDEPLDFSSLVGKAQELEPGLRCILAPNPSPMTHWGTNTYVLGTKELVVIDPGPDDPQHLNAILQAIGKRQKLSKIIVTHSHKDHSPLAAKLSAKTGAPIYGYGTSFAGRSAIMTQLAQQGEIGGGEGIDAKFAPDILVKHLDEIHCADMTLQVLHTPGHIGNHICLAWKDMCFTGDHIMGWASSLVSPPEGDLTDFMASCALLAKRKWRVFYAGHGAPIRAPSDRLSWLIDHRKSRENDILLALKQGPADARTLAVQIYTDVNPALLAAAERNVLAHLIDLYCKGQVAPLQAFETKAVFRLT